MGNMTLSMPNELQDRMRNFSEIKWSEVAREAITQKLKTLEKFNNRKKYSDKELYDFFTQAAEVAEDAEFYMEAQSEVVLKDE